MTGLLTCCLFVSKQKSQPLSFRGRLAARGNPFSKRKRLPGKSGRCGASPRGFRATARRCLRASASERVFRAGIAKGLPKPLGCAFGGFPRTRKATRARRRETPLLERCRFATIEIRSLSRLAATAPFRKGSRRVGSASREDRRRGYGFPRPPLAASE